MVLKFYHGKNQIYDCVGGKFTKMWEKAFSISLLFLLSVKKLNAFVLVDGSWLGVVVLYATGGWSLQWCLHLSFDLKTNQGWEFQFLFLACFPLLLLRRRKKIKIHSTTTTLIVKDELPKVFFEWGGGGEGRGGIVDKNFCLDYKGWVIFLRWSRNRWCSVRP